MDKGVRFLDPARNAQALFDRQHPAKMPLAQLRTFEPQPEGGGEVPAFRRTFDLRAETGTVAARSSGSSGRTPSNEEIWLGR
jgi:site-specific DNA recombinase